MKKHLYIIICLFLAIACIEEKEVAIMDAPTGVSLSSTAVETSIALNTSDSWRAVSNESWLKLSPNTGKAGRYEIKVSATANKEYTPRIAEITIYSGKFTHKILVEQAERKGISLNTNELFVGSAGDEIVLPFEANEKYTCTVDEECKDWISIVKTKSLQGHSLTLSVKENRGYDPREGLIRITTENAEETIKVHQSQRSELIVATTSYEIGSNGGQIRIPVSSSIAYNCEVLSSGEGWITVTSQQTKGLEEYFTVLNVSANTGYDGRVGQLRIYCADKESIITVSQQQQDEMIVSKTSFEIGSAGGSLTIPVQANVEYQSSILSGSDWLSIEKIGTKGLTSSSLKINVQENKGYDGRIGQIKLAGAGKQSVITVTQSQFDELIVANTQFEIGNAGGNISVPVESNIEYQYEVLYNGEGWIEVQEIQTKGLETSNLVLLVHPNETNDSRVGQVKVSGAGKESIITINQAASPLDTPSLPKDLSSEGSANCYIVSSAGTYKFMSVQGNSSESVGSVASAEVLWESFGTDETPGVGSLISGVSYQDNYITFSTPATYREGNAVIAAKDASGTILWSWHIWLTDKPEDQVYNNNAGTMMDRNLGATSATPGDVGALGLFYQWGRKDPFLGETLALYSGYDNYKKAASTLSWPSYVSSDSSYGTIAYATEHPTRFIGYNGDNWDWYYTGDGTTDNTRWQSTKTIYDPCPAGYRIPAGGSNGIWAIALGSSGAAYYDFDYVCRGLNFNNLTSSCWYPAAGCLLELDGSFEAVGDSGGYWSCSPDDLNNAYYLYLDSGGAVRPSQPDCRARGQSVRCVRE